VQNQETIVMLERAGVDFVQGYHVGRPAELSDSVKKRVAG